MNVKPVIRSFGGKKYVANAIIGGRGYVSTLSTKAPTFKTQHILVEDCASIILEGFTIKQILANGKSIPIVMDVLPKKEEVKKEVKKEEPKKEEVKKEVKKEEVKKEEVKKEEPKKEEPKKEEPKTHNNNKKKGKK